jgi:hypothetical protein
MKHQFKFFKLLVVNEYETNCMVLSVYIVHFNCGSLF